jgi:signal transduction histidine kinase
MLGALIAGGIGGLAAELVQSESRSSDQLRRAAAARASLGAALIDSELQTSGHGGVGPELRQALARDVADIAHYNVHAPQTSVFLVNGAGGVIAAATGRAAERPLIDRRLRRALAGGPATGTFGRRGDRFFAVARLNAAPWRVVYTVATSALYGSRGSAWTMSFLLLAGFGAAAGISLLLLIRVLSGSRKLARANASLAQRNRRIEDATEAKTRFVANMSHELRTPLNAVIGFSELMHEGRTGPVSKTQREYLGIIRASGDHLLKLINEVLDLSKIEAGHIRLDPEAVEPIVVAAQCVSSVRWLAADRRVRIDFDPAAVGPVSLDPARLRQVILNYLSNAIKFTGAGGRISLTLARDGDRLRVAVSDTGVGISDEDQPRVFDEFVQVGGKAHGGSGLGLAVTRQIVEAQGGTVGLDSQLGFGSTFIAWLPWVPAEVEIPRAGGHPNAQPEPEIHPAEALLRAAEEAQSGSRRAHRAAARDCAAAPSPALGRR